MLEKWFKCLSLVSKKKILSYEFPVFQVYERIHNLDFLSLSSILFQFRRGIDNRNTKSDVINFKHETYIFANLYV